jgi:non-specific serine/threonine protein kinase/serine/threonine-protein kinase
MPHTGERWARVKELFDAAVDLDASQRAAFLEKECGDDEALRHEVESLLKSDEQTGGFIEQPAFAIPGDLFPDDTEEPLAGRQFGAYEVIREIGRGGLGAVYLAARSDDEYRKQVAIKVIRRGLDTDDIIRRFRTERQILAQLDHPNIARLIDGGTTDDGLPYFVMDYVDGQTINAYCDAKALSTPERLGLFRKACAAVTYAHQNLVIHRDLKPSNILVTQEGEPKLLDFGIAKLLSSGDELFTETTPTLRVMTPEYASPEQIKGEKIATTSDVYSLGVLLYELLTGRRPYRLKTRAPEEIARAITEQEPERPSTAITRDDGNSKSETRNPKSLRGDLDNIVLMAMRKEPARRYSSVGQFSEDIRRHLEALPVIARKDTWRYRSEKFIKRNRVGVAAATLLVLSLLAGIVATAWQAQRATDQARIAAQQRDRAERRFSDVRRLSNALLFEIAPKIERLEGATEARQALLTQSLKYLDSLAQESSKDWALQSELAAAYEKVGDLQGNPTNPNLMVLTDALASYEKANAMRRKLLEKNTKDTEQRRLLANNYRVLGDLRWQTNEPTESLKNSETALRLYTELLAEQPGSTELRLATARAHYDIGQLFSSNEKFPDAIERFQKVIATTEELHHNLPDRIDVMSLLAKGRQQLGNALSWESKQKEGETEMAKAIEICERLVRANPNDSELSSALYQTYVVTSSVYENIDDPVATEYAFKALRVVEKMIERDPANLRTKQYLAVAYSRVGVTLSNIAKIAESVSYLEKAVTILQTLAQNETMNRRYRAQLGLALIRLGDARRKQEDFPGAIQDLGKAVAIYSELVTSDPSSNGSLKNLASANKLLADTHKDFAVQSLHADKQAHEQSAKENFLRARDLLRQLEARNALSEFDRKMLEEIQAAMRRYERE